ncbi:MAG: class I SAM-dependent methyltransferase [Nanoarchaeota archaeon]|nr:class I SAM-dependent methyltransferase [Nanoarchaeota archaeon]
MDLQITHRDGLPALAKRLGLTGKGVEIGVQSGFYSERLLAGSSLSRLYSIDSWKAFKKKDYDDISNLPQHRHHIAYLRTRLKLMMFGRRSKILRTLSQEAIKRFEDDSLDFIYIDANHTYEGCKGDMGQWWPKLRKGGLFAGHDYVDGKLPEGLFGVKSAVDEFSKKHEQRLYITKEKDFPSWYFIKE